MARPRGPAGVALPPHIQTDILRRKPIRWLGDSLNRVREFPDDARHSVGTELRHIQQGEEPVRWKPMAIVGAGVVELRVTAKGEYRVLYLARLADAVYVLHAFAKKSQRTPKSDIDLAARRYRELIAERREK